MSLFDLTKAASNKVDDIERRSGRHYDLRRTKYSVLTSTMSELGELAQEVMIKEGHSYKQTGTDGIVGEAVDTILCLLDLVHVVDSTITEKELNTIAKTKLNKWATSVAEREV